MEDSDVVTLESIERVRAITAREARRVLLVAVLAGPLAAVFVLVVVYALYGSLLGGLGAMLGAVFVLLGAWQAVHWARHYHSIRLQLQVLEQRVARGEVLYGSQVRFYSYR